MAKARGCSHVCSSNLSRAVAVCASIAARYMAADRIKC
jgi:hypothetical protein